MSFKTELKFHTTLRMGGKPPILFVPKTLDDIGKIYRLSRERIRQIKETALFKLQHPRRAGRLRPYIESNR